MSKRNILGRWQASCTVLFMTIYWLYFSILLFFQQLIHYKPANTKLFVYFFYGGFGVFLFLFLRIKILQPVKLTHIAAFPLKK
jgi:hypothetical protein